MIFVEIFKQMYLHAMTKELEKQSDFEKELQDTLYLVLGFTVIYAVIKKCGIDEKVETDYKSRMKNQEMHPHILVQLTFL